MSELQILPDVEWNVVLNKNFLAILGIANIQATLSILGWVDIDI